MYSPIYWLQVLLPSLAAAAVTMLLTPAVIRLAHHLQAVDVPGGRKRHRRSMPRLGGIAIVAGIVVSVGPGLALFSGKRFGAWSPTEALWFTVAAMIVFALGLADDVFGVGPFWKLLFQLVAASIVVGLGWQFTVLRVPLEGRFYFGALAPLLALVWIVGVTNAINFIDGLDGLAAGIVAIISSSLLVLAMFQRSPETVVVTSCIAGACVGFLRHNWRPAKIYMGDSGSLTLGFLLATISIRAAPSLKASATVAILVPILALGLPVFDTLLVMLYRFLRGRKLINRFARMFQADRAHLHHLLLDHQAERSRVMVILYGLAAGFCLMALLVAVSGNWWLGVTFLGVEFAAVSLIRLAGLNAEARRLTRERLTRLERTTGKPAGQEALTGETSASAHPRLGKAEATTK